MADYIILENEISDTYKMGGKNVIPDIIRNAREAINNGNRVIIRQKVEGLPHRDIRIISGQTEMDSFEKEVDQLIKFLEDHP